jgi:hypothetical protein
MKLGKYQHFKGSFADVIGLAKHSETGEELVIYWHIESESGENKLWARPREMFLEEIIKEGKTFPRFKYIGDKK